MPGAQAGLGVDDQWHPGGGALLVGCGDRLTGADLAIGVLERGHGTPRRGHRVPPGGQRHASARVDRHLEEEAGVLGLGCGIPPGDEDGGVLDGAGNHRGPGASARPRGSVEGRGQGRGARAQVKTQLGGSHSEIGRDALAGALEERCGTPRLGIQPRRLGPPGVERGGQGRGSLRVQR